MVIDIMMWYHLCERVEANNFRKKTYEIFLAFDPALRILSPCTYPLRTEV